MPSKHKYLLLLLILGPVTIWLIFSLTGPELNEMDRAALAEPPIAAGSEPLSDAVKFEMAVDTAKLETGLERLPSSLRGTEVDGELEVDENGHLIISDGIRRVFDYFLSALGEESVGTIVARIRAYIGGSLEEPAASEARHILKNYIDYKKALAGVQSTQNSAGKLDLDAVRRQMDGVELLRMQHLGPEVSAAFFGDDNTYDRYTLARLQILRNKSVSSAARDQQMTALEHQLPDSLRAYLEVINQYEGLQDATKDCRQRGCSTTELYQLRESMVGSEAVERLQMLDEQKADWDQRMKRWLAQRAAMLKNPGLSERDRQRQVDRLRGSLFASQELLRVQALERIHDQANITDGH